MEKCKRLRGWKLEEALGSSKKKKPLEKGRGSNLATALLSLWAHGKLSAIQIRKLAHAAVLDGCNHVELADMSKAGNYGEVPGNVHRDLMCRFVKDVCIPEPMELEVTCLDTKSLKKEKVMASLFLPHIMFAQLATLENFHEVFPLEKVEQFWCGVERSKDPRLEGHPCTRGKKWKKMCIPVWLHGDGVEYAVEDSLMCWSWGPLMTNFSPLEAKFLIACFPKASTAPETWTEIMQHVCWSLNALVQGVHPMHDAFGKPLKKGSHFLKKRASHCAQATKQWCGASREMLNSSATTWGFLIGEASAPAWNVIAHLLVQMNPNGSKQSKWTSNPSNTLATVKLLITLLQTMHFFIKCQG